MPDYADAARRAFDWIGSVGVAVDGGVGWREGDAVTDDLYSGTAGVLFGCAEAAASGLDVTRVAAGARDRLVHAARHTAAYLPEDGLFGGWPGVAAALRAWARVAGDAAAADAAAAVCTTVAAAAATAGDGYTDIISGDAGVILALLADRSAQARQSVELLAARLVAAAEPAPVGLHWRMVAGYELITPGFSHGTAGVAYALAAAGQALDRPDLIDVAIRGAEALLDVGDHPGGWAVPLSIPPQAHRPPVFFGWCHGPTGTARLFVLLNEIDPQPRWAHAVDACLQAIRDSGLPARRYPGFWDNVARCCGTAGVGKLLLDRYHATGDPALLAWADSLADDVVARAIAAPDGLTWSNTEHTATPPDLPPEPGLMQGTAGIGGWLAALAAAHRGAAPVNLVGLEPPWI